MSKKRNSKKSEGKQTDAVIIVHKYPSFMEWVGNASLSISNSKVTLWLSLFLMIISIIVYYPTLGDDYDIWFHLKYGEHYVKNLTWTIDHSQFSWTPSISDWKYVTWISSSILYIAFQVASGPGLYVIQWLLFFSIWTLYFYYIKSLEDSLNINHVMCLYLVMISLNLTACYVKPELFSTLLFSITLFIYFYTKSSSKNLFFLYPILFLIWVNTHGGFLIGLFFISLALGGEIANLFLLKKASLQKKLLKYFAISIVLSYIAILINPHGISYHTQLLKYLFSKEYMGEATQLFAYFNLWDYLFFKDFMLRFINTAWAFILMIILFFITCVYSYRNEKHFDISIFAINLAFFYFGMKTARASIFFPLIWFFSVLYTIKKGKVIPLKIKFSPFSLWFIILLTCYIFYGSLRYYEHRSWFGINLKEWIPVKEVEFIKKHKIPGPIFNDYVIGGYMIWAMYPDYQVFIDPRYGPYIKQVWPDWLGLRNNLNPEGLKKFTSKYHFKSALIHLREPNIIFWLLSSPEWRFAYFDKNAALIIHETLVPLLSPEALGTSLSPQRFKDLTNPLLIQRLFDFYLKINPAYAREILTLYEQNVSSFYKYKKGIIQSMKNLINQAELELQQRKIKEENQKTKNK